MTSIALMLALPDASRILSCLRFTGLFFVFLVFERPSHAPAALRGFPHFLSWASIGRTCGSRPSRCSLNAQEVPAARRLGGSESPKVGGAPLNGCLLQFALWFQCSLFRRQPLSELTPRLCQVDVQQVVAMFCIVELSDVRPLVIMATACSLSSFSQATHTCCESRREFRMFSRSDWRAHLPSRSSV